MVRIRLVTTPIWSEEHLVAALAQVGFADVERQRQSVPLDSWRGTPLGAEASLIVRRKHLGAASDDLGFVRNGRGSFDMVLSEGHFFRFDRRWIEDLARRHDELVAAAGRTPPANLPGWERRELADPPPVPARGAPAPAAARAVRADAATLAQHAARARAEAASALDELRQQQKKADGPGCLLALVAPILFWGVIAGAEPGLRGGAGFFGVVLPLWFALAILRAIRMGRRARRGAARLLERLPSSEAAKAAAQEFLEGKVKPEGAKTEDALAKELLKAVREPRT
ncbi:MAG: hypothetical protein JNK02_10620 [Planctomycetes bacterium]|nr:hypothetical protein [Planctomycetota bacterium]